MDVAERRWPVAGRGFELQGHRGARALRPENTLAAFAHAMALGVTAVELDCVVSRDGVIVVTHDPELNPDLTRDAAGNFLAATGPAVRSLSMAQLGCYDVGRLRPGSRYGASYPEQVAVDGERLPSLVQVLELVRRTGQGAVWVNIEVKLDPTRPELTPPPAEFAGLLVADLDATAMRGHVFVQCFDWRVVREVLAIAPDVVTAALTEQQGADDTVWVGRGALSPWLAGFDPAAHGQSVPRMVAALGARIWAPDHLDLTAVNVAEAHALGLGVLPWTVNAAGDMERMLGIGVDGIITDRPDRLRSILAARGRPLPPPAGAPA